MHKRASLKHPMESMVLSVLGIGDILVIKLCFVCQPCLVHIDASFENTYYRKQFMIRFHVQVFFIASWIIGMILDSCKSVDNDVIHWLRRDYKKHYIFPLCYLLLPGCLRLWIFLLNHWFRVPQSNISGSAFAQFPGVFLPSVLLWNIGLKCYYGTRIISNLFIQRDILQGCLKALILISLQFLVD